MSFGFSRLGTGGRLTIAGTPSLGHTTVSVASLSFTDTLAGSNPATQQFTVTNTGQGSIGTPVVTASQPWLTTTMTGSGPWTVTVGCLTGSLGIATYTDTITVAASNADNPPVAVAVTFIVTASVAHGNYVAPDVTTLPTGITWDATNGRPSGGVFLTDYAKPTFSGTNRAATGRAAVQAAIDASVDGDLVTVDVASTIQTIGTSSPALNLPNRGTSGWVNIRPSTFASLPAYTKGDAVSNWDKTKRVTSADTANLWKIETLHNNTPVFTFAQGSQGWWIDGMEARVESSFNGTFDDAVVKIQANTQTQSSHQPDRIVINHSWIHNNSVPSRASRGITGNAKNLGIFHSTIEGFEATGKDTQAFISFNGEGPIALVGSMFGGMAENVFFGGADPSITGLNPTNIDIRFNYIPKQNGWAGNANLKNMLEFKKGVNAFVFGNVFDGGYWGGQQHSLVLKATNQSSGDPTALLQNVIVAYNKWYNQNAGFVNIAGNSETYVSAKMNHVEVAHNVVYAGTLVPGSPGTPTGTNKPIQVLLDSHSNPSAGYDYVRIHHNSLSIAGNSHLFIGDPPSAQNYTNFRFDSNVNDKTGQFGFIFATGGATNKTCLDSMLGSANWQCRTNAMASNTNLGTLNASSYNNIATSQQIYTSATDFTIPIASTALKAKGYDGDDPGALILLVDTHTANIR